MKKLYAFLTGLVAVFVFFYFFSNDKKIAFKGLLEAQLKKVRTLQSLKDEDPLKQHCFKETALIPLLKSYTYTSQFNQAFERSCQAFSRHDPYERLGPYAVFGEAADYQKICKKYKELAPHDASSWLSFLYDNFTAFEIVSKSAIASPSIKAKAVPLMRGATQRQKFYEWPLFKRPVSYVPIPDFSKFSQVSNSSSNKKAAAKSKNEVVNTSVLIWLTSAYDFLRLCFEEEAIVYFENNQKFWVSLDVGPSGVTQDLKEELRRTGMPQGSIKRRSALKKWASRNEASIFKIVKQYRDSLFFKAMPVNDRQLMEKASLYPYSAQTSALLPKGPPLVFSYENPLKSSFLDHSNSRVTQIGFVTSHQPSFKNPLRVQRCFGFDTQAEVERELLPAKQTLYVLLPKALNEQASVKSC